MFEFDEMTYSSYFSQVKKDLKELIDKRRNASTLEESKLQEFFVQYPSSLLSSLNGIDSQYQVLGNCIITQPILKSHDGDRKPDFLIVTWNSLNLYFNFIEIEDPSKKIFKARKQELTSEFYQAYNQLKQWKSFSKNEIESYCNSLLTTLFRDNFNNTPDKVKNYNYIIVYGFGEEVKNKGEKYNHLLQNYFTESDIYHCTYSRLARTIRNKSGIFTVKKNHELNKFVAVACTTFSSYRPSDWSELHNIEDKITVIEKHPIIEEEHKKKLITEINELDNKPLKEIHKIMDDDMGLT